MFSARWIKTVSTFGVALLVGSSAFKSIRKDNYLYDLALEYQYNFSGDKLTCKECDPLLDKLFKERFSETELILLMY